MAQKKAVAKKDVQLVKAQPARNVLAAVTTAIGPALKNLAGLLSQPLQPGELSEVYQEVSNWYTVLEDLKKSAREGLLTLLTEKGEVATAAGTRRLTIDGYRLEARPTKTGYDPKLVEARVRALGKDPASYMVPEVSYSVSELGLKKLVDEKLLTADEVETLRYKPSFAVQQPRRLDVEE